MSVDAFISHAVEARRASSWADSIELLRNALVLDSTHPRAHAELALSLLAGRRLRAAEREATLAVGYATASGDDFHIARAYYALASVSAARGRLALAREQCDRALLPSSADASILCAHLNDQLGDHESAYELSQMALDTEPDNPRALAAYALFRRLGEVAEADVAISRALALAPLDPDVNLAAARIALDAHDNIDGARVYLRVVLGRDSYHREALALWLSTKSRTAPVATHLWRVGLWLRRTIELEDYAVICAWMLLATLASIIARHVGAIAVANYLRYAWVLFFGGVWLARYLSRSFDAEVNGLPSR